MKYECNLLIRIMLCFLPVSLFYFLFTYPTLYGSYLLLLYYKPVLIGQAIIIGNILFNVVEACIGGVAYLLLLLLILLTKEIAFKNRIKLFIIGSILIYLFNIIRISALIFLAVNYNLSYFDSIHLFIWKFFSGVYVALIWIFLVIKYKIKDVPILSDAKYLYKKSYFK